MNQLNTEFRFSKKMKSFIVLDSFLNDEPTELMNDLASKISTWRDGDFSISPQKQKLVDALPDTESIVYELMIVILGNFRYQAIQGLSIQLGRSLGYEDLIDACKIGSSIIGLCHGDLYDIHFEVDGTFVNPRLRMDAESERRCRALCYMPPIKQKAPEWSSNTGGWIWDKKSVILGEGNHHWDTQALDVLNKVQKIAWVIDPDVLANETNPNTEMNRSQFNEIVEDYIDEEFYFNWQYDKRGRMYASGYDLSPQSNEYGKALLSPSVGEKLTKEGEYALEIAIAGHLGYDKLTWDERVSAVGNLVTDDDFNSMWKEPILGRKALRASDRATSGEPINYFMQLDATASFAQIAAVLTGCVATGKLCNLVDTGKRENLYQTVHDAMEERVPMGDVQTKKAVMTHTYNSVKNPRETFNDDQLEVFYEVMEGLMPGAEALKSLINRTWDDSTLEHSWRLPDGHVCRVPVVEMEDIHIRIDELGGRRFTLRYSKNQPSRNYRSLAPNTIHSVDAYINREMIRRCDFELASIHDCWNFHPNHFEEVKQTYREILSEIASSTLLNDIVSEIQGCDAGIVIEDEGLAEMILDSEYALS